MCSCSTTSFFSFSLFDKLCVCEATRTVQIEKAQCWPRPSHRFILSHSSKADHYTTAPLFTLSLHPMVQPERYGWADDLVRLETSNNASTPTKHLPTHMHKNPSVHYLCRTPEWISRTHTILASWKDQAEANSISHKHTQPHQYNGKKHITHSLAHKFKRA